MKTIELYIDEENEFSGIEAISVVENPAIEEDFIALKKQQVQLAEVDKEKRILMGAALIPNKKIYRTNGEDEYNIFFSEETNKNIAAYLKKGQHLPWHQRVIFDGAATQSVCPFLFLFDPATLKKKTVELVIADGTRPLKAVMIGTIVLQPRQAASSKLVLKNVFFLILESTTTY